MSSHSARRLPGLRSVSVTAAALDRAPRTNRRLVVLLLAAVTVAVEVASFIDAIPVIGMGRINLSPSVVPALILAIACGDRLLGRARTRPAATAFWVVTATAFVVGTALYLRTDNPADVPGLVLAAMNEELVYRLALPAMLALMLRTIRIPAPAARVAGFVGAGVWFVLLPGHQDQMTSVQMVAPFLAFAALTATMVYRSGSVMAVAAAHACSNLLTILAWSDEVNSGARSAVLCSLLILLAFAYGRTRRYVETDDGVIIDLRTGAIALLDLRDRPGESDGLGADGLGFEPIVPGPIPNPAVP